ncbi:MAG: hypothetical protein V4555_09275 [Acidobacteriota bacterium]
MSLLDAPAYDPTADNRKRNIIIAAIATIFLLIVLAFTGYVSGHGWLFTNLGAEHKINRFFVALEAKDYATAYGIYNNDPAWQQHPQQYSGYPLQRFTEDWTTFSPIKAPITQHHVDKSISDGSGALGTGVIVAVRVNGDNKVFMYVNKTDGTITWPAPHMFEY